MAGYEEIQEELSQQSNQGYDWVKPGDLINWKQAFCIQAIEQDSFNQNGKPQYTVAIIYARQGLACERAFNLECNEYRDKRVAKMIDYMKRHNGLMHHMMLVKRPNKTHPEWPFTDFADVPGKMADDACVCRGAGIIDPAKPETWTPHYALTHTLNEALSERKQPPMDTSAMTEEALMTMLKVMGVEY